MSVPITDRNQRLGEDERAVRDGRLKENADVNEPSPKKLLLRSFYPETSIDYHSTHETQKVRNINEELLAVSLSIKAIRS